MSGLVFYFENNDIDVWSGRKMDLDAWNYNCKIGNINDVIIVNKSSINIQPFDRGMNIEIVDELPNLNGHITQLVTNTEMKKYKKTYSELWDFNHKTDWYIFGPANGWVGNYFADTLLNIPQNNDSHHHSIFIANTVMFHRYNVLNNNNKYGS